MLLKHIFLLELCFSVLDDLCRKRKQLIEELGDDAGEDVTVITGAISKLKYELQTDKPITTFKGSIL